MSALNKMSIGFIIDAPSHRDLPAPAAAQGPASRNKYGRFTLAEDRRILEVVIKDGKFAATQDVVADLASEMSIDPKKMSNHITDLQGSLRASNPAKIFTPEDIEKYLLQRHERHIAKLSNVKDTAWHANGSEGRSSESPLNEEEKALVLNNVKKYQLHTDRVSWKLMSEELFDFKHSPHQLRLFYQYHLKKFKSK